MKYWQKLDQLDGGLTPLKSYDRASFEEGRRYYNYFSNNHSAVISSTVSIDLNPYFQQYRFATNMLNPMSFNFTS